MDKSKKKEPIKFYLEAAPSPTTMKGAQNMGWAYMVSSSCISSSMERRNASAGPMVASASEAANISVVNRLAASEGTAQ